MITLTDEDRRFYKENAPALIGYIQYVKYVIANKEKFGGEENVILALQIGKFIGRNNIDPKEFEEVKARVNKLCNGNKVKRVINLLQNKDELHHIIKMIIEKNPESFLLVSPNGEFVRDKNGDMVPNLMKISIAVAQEMEGQF